MRIVLCLILLCFKLFALDVSFEKVPVYKKIEASYNIKSLNQAVNNKKLFKTISYYVRIFKNKSNDGLWLRIPLHNKSHKQIKRVFISRWDRVDLELFAFKDDNKLFFKEKISSDEYIKKSKEIDIAPWQTVDLYVHIKAKDSLDQFFYIYILDSKIVNDFIISYEKLYHGGLFFGILLTMTMYSFFMFLSMGDKGYLFLGFYQVSVLITSSLLIDYSFTLLKNHALLADFLLRDLPSYIIMVFSILFTKEFLNTKKQMPKLNIFLNMLMVLLLPISLIDSSINYASFLFILFVSVGAYVYFEKRSLVVLFYTLGFLAYPLYLVVLNLSILFDWDMYFEFDYAKQIFTCIESFALTMALYLKIRFLIEEKEKASKEAVEKEMALLEQSRFASMGEMLASIAHQWRQPLNHLNMIFATLQLAHDSKKLDTKYLRKKSQEADNQLKYMSSTIESFSNFFSTKGKKEEFYLLDVCEYSLTLIESRLKKYKVEIFFICNDKTVYKNYKNELIQVISIVLNNAIDALIINKIEKPSIEIVIETNKIKIIDNAKGIKKEILPNIFDPYFSTKNKKFGTGLGLYTSKIIMKNHIKGTIEAKNITKGALFTITIP